MKLCASDPSFPIFRYTLVFGTITWIFFFVFLPRHIDLEVCPDYTYWAYNFLLFINFFALLPFYFLEGTSLYSSLEGITFIISFLVHLLFYIALGKFLWQLGSSHRHKKIKTLNDK